MDEHLFGNSCTFAPLRTNVDNLDKAFLRTEKLISDYLQDGTYLSPIESIILENNLEKIRKQIQFMSDSLK